MARTTIQFWGGLRTIGGTIVVVQEGIHRVILDFGTSYSPAEPYYDHRVQPRRRAVLREWLTLGLAPRLSGVYHRDLLTDIGLRAGPSEPPAETAVWVSHLHLDHDGLTGTVAPGIPVYSETDGARLAEALQEVGQAPPGLPRAYVAAAAGEPVQVGPLRVTPVPVDHDLPGACGFLVETGSGTVAYTGDLRLHGAHPERTEAFMARAAAARPVALICEGTRLGEVDGGRGPALSEPEVGPRIAEVVAASAGLAIVNLYPRHVERVAAVGAAAAAAGRRLALEPATARLLTRLGGSLSGTAVYLPDEEQAALVRGRAPAWLELLLGTASAAGAPVVGARHVRAEPQHWAIQMGYAMLPELVELQPPPGSVWIQAGGEPLGRFDPAHTILERWLARFDMQLASVHSTGHAAPADLERIVAAIAPRVLMPAHSRCPELLDLPGQSRLLPEYGTAYDLDQLGG